MKGKAKKYSGGSKFNTKPETPASKRYATSDECERCETKCRRGELHLARLRNKGKSNCPLCPNK
jgi:hypothetical protein